MSVIDLNQNQMADLFALPNETATKGPVRFGAATDIQPADMFASTTEETTQSPSTTDQTTETPASSTTEQTTQEPISADENKADILTNDSTTVKKDTAKNEIKDISNYFEAGLKSGKFVAIEEDAEDGTKRNFIPKTFDEFDEVIDIQVDYKLNQKVKDLDQKWYQSKSPAWQAVAKYSELTDNPAEILPFIQGVKNIDSVKDLDPAEIEQAERIVRTRFNQKGENEEAIEEQIEALKTTGKLVSAAQKYKPLILKEEKQYLSQLMKQKEEENQEYLTLVSQIRDKAIEAIEKPIFGKEKLKQEEKAAVYNMIAEPSPETSGYRIYSVIDQLYEKGDFEMLAMAALLLSKKESLLNYISTNAADQTAAGIQKKLRVATDSRTAAGATQETEDRQVVNRGKYSSTPKFGR